MQPLTPAVLSLTMALCALTNTAAAASGAERPMPRLRSANAPAQRVLERALNDSPTVRALASEITASDLIVYVEIAHLESRARATTELVTVTAQNRFLRITLQTLTPPYDLIPLLAHELQHAVEIAREPSVRDTASLRALYTRIGIDPMASHTFETVQARLTERAVRSESRQRQY
jgi:hypothetical protein